MQDTHSHTAIVAGCDANNLIERHLVWLSRCQIISLAERRDGKCKWCGQVRCSLMENLCRPEPTAHLSSPQKRNKKIVSPAAWRSLMVACWCGWKVRPRWSPLHICRSSAEQRSMVQFVFCEPAEQSHHTKTTNHLLLEPSLHPPPPSTTVLAVLPR